MFPLRNRRVLALLLLAAVLFAQAAHAVEACLQPPAAAAKVVGADSMANCHGMSSKAGCLTQLTAPDQNSGQATIAAFETPGQAGLKFAPAAPRVLETPHWKSTPPATDPPLTIRFCSFLL